MYLTTHSIIFVCHFVYIKNLCQFWGFAQSVHKVHIHFVIVQITNSFVNRSRLVKFPLEFLSNFSFGFEVIILPHVLYIHYQLCPAKKKKISSINEMKLSLGRPLNH
jgi:hypothetical protein